VLKRLRRIPFAVLLLALVGPSALAQQFTVQNEAGKQTVLSRADLEALPHVKVSSGSGGAMYEGADLRAVLEKGGVELGASMKGKKMASCLLVEAADGYRVVIALPEIDPAFNDKQFVLAFLRDGKVMDDSEGPYRLVISEEKRMARWVRQVKQLKIVAVQ
jgi:hypothetical protein